MRAKFVKEDLQEYQKKFKVGDKVIFKKELPALDFGDVGILISIHKADKINKKDWGVVIYPHNEGLPKHINKVYSHSAYLNDLKIVENNEKI